MALQTLIGSRVSDAVAASKAAFAMTTAGLVAMQTLPIDSTDSQMIRWAVQVGGPLFLALLIVLYFYRRDFKVTETRLRDQAEQVMQIAQTAVAAVQAQKDSNDRLTSSHEYLAREVARLGGAKHG